MANNRFISIILLLILCHPTQAMQTRKRQLIFPGGQSAKKAKLELVKNQDLTCEDCKKKFCNKYKLERHLQTHAKSKAYKYRCSHCRKKFNRKENLVRHIEIHDKLEAALFVCELCNLTFKKIQHLQAHEKSDKHLGIIRIGSPKYEDDAYPYKCHVCKQGFPEQRRLESHEGTEKHKQVSAIVLKNVRIVSAMATIPLAECTLELDKQDEIITEEEKNFADSLLALHSS